MRLFFLCLLCGLCFLSACNPATTPEIAPSITPSQQSTTPVPTALPSATTSPTPTPTPLPLNGQQTVYTIDATINYYNRLVTVKSHSLYTNKSNVPINEMVFIVYPTVFDSFYLRSVTINGGMPTSDYRWESHRMIVPLEAPLLPGEQIEFLHDFDLYMPDRAGVFGQTGRQLTLSYWYPAIPPYDETEGWLAYEFSLVNGLFVGEHQSFESADFNVALQFTDREENLDIAAGAIPVEQDGVYSFHLPLARTFALAISDIYTIIERETLNTTIKGYAFPEDIETTKAVVELADNALTLFTEHYGPYTREVLSVVDVVMDINMEFDGIFFVQSSLFWHYKDPPKTDLTIIIPHETSHQWFYSQVGNNQALEPWLDEAFATYSEALFYERYHPEHLDWWWNARVNAHLPTGTIDPSIYLSGGVPEYFNRVYRRGALFMQDLRDTIGEEAFFDFLKAYVRLNQYQIASSDDFWSVLLQFTEADLTPLLDEYFSDPPTIP